MYTLDVKICRVICVEHSAGDIRDVLACVAFACDINLVSLHAEGRDEVLPKSLELFRDIMLVVYRNISSRGESSANWLIDVYDVCEVHPAVRVCDWGIGPRLP